MKADRVIICGQGPSWADVDTDQVHRARNAGVVVIAVNGAVECVRADYFFTLDLSDANRARLADPIEGVRYVVAFPEPEADRLDHVTYLHRVQKPRRVGGAYRTRAGMEAPGGLADDPGKIHTGNSAFGALNLAYHMGARYVVLLGVDGHGLRRWDGTRNNYLDHMPALFETAVPQLDARGMHVVNGSPRSHVACFPIVEPHHALDWVVNGEGPWSGGSLAPAGLDPEIVRRVQALAAKLDRVPTVRDAVLHDQTLLTLTSGTGYGFSATVRAVLTDSTESEDS